MVSTPGTDSLELHTWGSLRSLNSFDQCQPACDAAFRLEQSGHANLDRLTIDDLKLKVTALRDVGIRLGISSAIEGSYGTVEFGWHSITATPDIEAGLRACVISWCSELVSFSWQPGTIPVNVLFRLGVSHWAPWYDAATPVPCGPWWDPWSRVYHVVIDVNPHPHHNSQNGFAVSAATAEGAAWVVTPNLGGVVPAFAMDMLQAVTSPLGGGLKGSFPCV